MLDFTLMTTFVGLLAGSLCTNGANLDEGQLVTVVLVFRHGDRVIVEPYPNDPYKNNSLWPAGWGQLTNNGKLQQYQLGQWFRSRYKNFLPDRYSEKDIYVRSTDVDRTLMSAEANLAGLYPPLGDQDWDPAIPWQPIPVHTKPEKDDAVLAMKKPCPRYDMLYKKLMNSPEIVALNKKNHDLYAYLAKNAGSTVLNVVNVEYIYNTLFIERANNFTLPDWTKPVFPDKLKPLADISFALPSYTPELARLKTGPFFHELLDNLFNVTVDDKHRKSDHRLWIYSAHDTTIANVLQSLGVFERHSPPYCSTVMFELRRLRGEFYVNVLYKNSSEPQALTLKGCDFNCPLEQFVRLLDPINVDVDSWERECRITLTALLEVANTGEIALAVVVLVLCAILLGIVMMVMYNRYKRSNMVYVRLPDDDERA